MGRGSEIFISDWGLSAGFEIYSGGLRPSTLSVCNAGSYNTDFLRVRGEEMYLFL